MKKGRRSRGGTRKRIYTEVAIAGTTAFLVVAGLYLAGWIWNRVNINENESDIDKLQSQTKYLSRNVFYVSKTGNDNNPGTEKKPWLTLKHAAEELRIKKNVELRIGEGEFEANSSDFEFSMVAIYGTTEVVTTLNITSSTSLGDGRYRLNVTNTLVPDSLVYLPFYLNSTSQVIVSVVLENGVDYVITEDDPGGSSSLIDEGGIVKDNTLTIITLINNGDTPNFANGSSVYYEGITFNSNGTIVSTQYPLDITFLGCTFVCNDNGLQLARGGNFFASGCYFDQCKISTTQTMARIHRSVISEGRFTSDGGNGDINYVYSTGFVVLQNAASYQVSYSIFDVESNVAITCKNAHVDFEVITSNSDNSYPMTISQGSDVYIQQSTFTCNNTLQMLLIFSDATVTIEGIHFIRNSGGGSGIMIHAIDAHVYLGGTDYVFRGKTTGLLVAVGTEVKLNQGLFIGNQTINGGGVMDHMIVFTEGSSVEATGVTIEFTNLTNAGILFEESEVNFKSGNILLETGNRVGVEIARSTIYLGEGLNLTINTSSADVTRSPIYARTASTLTIAGNTDLSNDAGTCLYANDVVTTIIEETASTTLFCGLKEFQILWESSLHISNSSETTLSPGTVDNTTLGGEYNTTTFYAGTADISYTDGIGPGLQGCKIMVTT